MVITEMAWLDFRCAIRALIGWRIVGLEIVFLKLREKLLGYNQWGGHVSDAVTAILYEVQLVDYRDRDLT